MNRNDNILRFYILATSLKNKIRQGSIYWNVTAPRRESIAEHVYDTCMLAIAIHSEYKMDKELLNYAFCQDFKELLEKYLNKRVWKNQTLFCC